MQLNPSNSELCPGCGQPLVVDPRKKILDALPERGYIRQKLLIPHLIPYSPATLWRRVKAGEFPAPTKISPRISAWRIEEVKAWLKSNPDARPRMKKKHVGPK
jgi:prophage regulatory protein